MKPETIEDFFVDIMELQGRALVDPWPVEITKLPPFAEQNYLLALDCLSQASGYMKLSHLYLLEEK